MIRLCLFLCLLPCLAKAQTVNTNPPLSGANNTSATGSLGCPTCATTTNGGPLSGVAPITVSPSGAIDCAGCLTASQLAGLITISLTPCPAGWTEASEFNGKTLIGTLAANGNAGTTGGADSITPAGVNSAPVFTGTPFSSVINHTHTVTVTYQVQGGTTAATTGTHVMTSTATGGSARAPTTGDAVSATTANPSGGVSSITPAGTVAAPVFTGNSFDNRSAFVRVIFCRKN